MRNEPVGSVGRVCVLDRSTWSAVGPRQMDFFQGFICQFKSPTLVLPLGKHANTKIHTKQ